MAGHAAAGRSTVARARAAAAGAGAEEAAVLLGVVSG